LCGASDAKPRRQDETRLGLKTETGKLITAFGVKPVAPVLCQRDNFWLYGVVEPLSGWHFCQEYAHLNTECFQQFIDTLAEQLGEDALIQMADRRCSCNESIAMARKFNFGLSACT
jgi:hypothetical protein